MKFKKILSFIPLSLLGGMLCLSIFSKNVSLTAHSNNFIRVEDINFPSEFNATETFDIGPYYFKDFFSKDVCVVRFFTSQSHNYDEEFTGGLWVRDKNNEQWHNSNENRPGMITIRNFVTGEENMDYETTEFKLVPQEIKSLVQEGLQFGTNTMEVGCILDNLTLQYQSFVINYYQKPLSINLNNLKTNLTSDDNNYHCTVDFDYADHNAAVGCDPNAINWSLSNVTNPSIIINDQGNITWPEDLSSGTYNFTVNVASALVPDLIASKNMTLTIPPIVPTSISIEGQDHLSGIAGSSGSSQYVAILNPNNADGNVTWSLNDDANSNITINPAGLLSWNNNLTQGTYNLIVTATSSLDSNIVAHKNVTLTIDYATPTGISINGDANLLGTVKVSGSSSYTATVLPNNANRNVTWSLQDNHEPDKISINDQGILSWNDSLSPGTYQFNVIATSVQTPSLFASKTVTLTISYASPILGDISLTKGSGDATINGNVISQILGTTSTFNASCNIDNITDIDPSLPKTWSINNAPSGVSIDGSSGLMTINHPIYGNNQTINMTYTVGSVSKNATYVLNVTYATPVFSEITLSGDGVLDDHNINLALNQTATITPTCNVSNSQYVDPSLTNQWSLKNQPSGVSIDATSGIISIPNNLAKGNYSFSIVYRYGASTKESNVNLEIGYELPRLSNISLTSPENLTIQDHNVKVNYHQAASFQAQCEITNIDQIDPSLTLQWSLLNAPSGISIDQNGLVKIANNADAISDWSLQIVCHVGKITSTFDINLSIIKSNPSIASNPIFWAVLIPLLVIILIILLVVLFDYKRKHSKK